MTNTVIDKAQELANDNNINLRSRQHRDMLRNEMLAVLQQQQDIDIAQTQQTLIAKAKRATDFAVQEKLYAAAAQLTLTDTHVKQAQDHMATITDQTTNLNETRVNHTQESSKVRNTKDNIKKNLTTIFSSNKNDKNGNKDINKNKQETRTDKKKGGSSNRSWIQNIKGNLQRKKDTTNKPQENDQSNKDKKDKKGLTTQIQEGRKNFLKNIGRNKSKDQKNKKTDTGNKQGTTEKLSLGDNLKKNRHEFLDKFKKWRNKQKNNQQEDNEQSNKSKETTSKSTLQQNVDKLRQKIKQKRKNRKNKKKKPAADTTKEQEDTTDSKEKSVEESETNDDKAIPVWKKNLNDLNEKIKEQLTKRGILGKKEKKGDTSDEDEKNKGKKNNEKESADKTKKGGNSKGEKEEKIDEVEDHEKIMNEISDLKKICEEEMKEKDSNHPALKSILGKVHDMETRYYKDVQIHNDNAMEMGRAITPINISDNKDEKKAQTEAVNKKLQQILDCFKKYFGKGKGEYEAKYLGKENNGGVSFIIDGKEITIPYDKRGSFSLMRNGTQLNPRFDIADIIYAFYQNEINDIKNELQALTKKEKINKNQEDTGIDGVNTKNLPERTKKYGIEIEEDELETQSSINGTVPEKAFVQIVGSAQENPDRLALQYENKIFFLDENDTKSVFFPEEDEQNTKGQSAKKGLGQKETKKADPYLKTINSANTQEIKNIANTTYQLYNQIYKRDSKNSFNENEKETLEKHIGELSKKLERLMKKISKEMIKTEKKAVMNYVTKTLGAIKRIYEKDWKNNSLDIKKSAKIIKTIKEQINELQREEVKQEKKQTTKYHIPKLDNGTQITGIHQIEEKDGERHIQFTITQEDENVTYNIVLNKQKKLDTNKSMPTDKLHNSIHAAYIESIAKKIRDKNHQTEKAEGQGKEGSVEKMKGEVFFMAQSTEGYFSTQNKAEKFKGGTHFYIFKQTGKNTAQFWFYPHTQSTTRAFSNYSRAIQPSLVAKKAINPNTKGIVNLEPGEAQWDEKNGRKITKKGKIDLIDTPQNAQSPEDFFANREKRRDGVEKDMGKTQKSKTKIDDAEKFKVTYYLGTPDISGKQWYDERGRGTKRDKNVGYYELKLQDEDAQQAQISINENSNTAIQYMLDNRLNYLKKTCTISEDSCAYHEAENIKTITPGKVKIENEKWVLVTPPVIRLVTSAEKIKENKTYYKFPMIVNNQIVMKEKLDQVDKDTGAYIVKTKGDNPLEGVFTINTESEKVMAYIGKRGSRKDYIDPYCDVTKDSTRGDIESIQLLAPGKVKKENGQRVVTKKPLVHLIGKKVEKNEDNEKYTGEIEYYRFPKDNMWLSANKRDKEKTAFMIMPNNEKSRAKFTLSDSINEKTLQFLSIHAAKSFKDIITLTPDSNKKDDSQNMKVIEPGIVKKENGNRVVVKKMLVKIT